MTEPAIRIDSLRKVFRARERGAGLRGAARSLIRPVHREVVAVDRISFSIEPGERVAFVGPNGAGKSTTIKMLSGILQPDSGDVRVLGLVPWKERQRLGFRIGTVFGQRSQLWYHLPARDAFELLARIYELEPNEYRERLKSLIEAFDVGDLLDRPVRQLSLGQRMRCEIVASLLHRPEILFLDEPTIGLDVTAKSVIRDLVRDAAERDGSTVLLTSHDTGDMERVCDRVIVINEGRLILDCPVRDLRTEFIRRKMVTLLTAEEHVDLQLEGTAVVERAPYRTVLEIDTRRAAVGEVVQAALARTTLRDLTVEDPPLEEIVQEIYHNRDHWREAGPS
ncbi:MAG: ATP-binding cassette domain-containing protein [Planctomycetes bacterium]|nr:ATP-binding cassette domain-containing protein [Planctomycetota bacterium]